MELLKAIIEGKRAELEQLEAMLEGSNGKTEKTAAKPAKAEKEKAAKPVATKAGVGEYGNMKSTELYKECCRRGISSKCTSRSKEFLINVLLEDDGVKPAKAEKAAKPAAAKSEPAADDWGDDWGDDEKEKSPYEGKTARELYDMCRERGLDAEKRQDAVVYAKMLEENDKGNDAVPDDDDDGEDWNID